LNSPVLNFPKRSGCDFFDFDQAVVLPVSHLASLGFTTFSSEDNQFLALDSFHHGTLDFRTIDQWSANFHFSFSTDRQDLVSLKGRPVFGIHEVYPERIPFTHTVLLVALTNDRKHLFLGMLVI